MANNPLSMHKIGQLLLFLDHDFVQIRKVRLV